VRWDDFAAACPQLAELAQARFGEDQLVLLGSLRRDGWPRISPVEPDITAGELLVGMIPGSLKARDLLRDPRCTLHSRPLDLTGRAGDIKLYAHAYDDPDPKLRRAYQEAIFTRTQWQPTEPYHCFRFDIRSAGLVRFHDQGREAWSWRAGQPMRTQVIGH
jgi:hypothetical protein